MQTLERTYTIKNIIENIENGRIVFDHPMQRKTGQWNREQQSLLIHSILAGYAIPQTYAVQLFESDFDSFSVLDGKQRYTTIFDFVHDGFKLVDDTPVIYIKKRKVITDESGNRRSEHFIEEYEIAGKYFSELDDTLKEEIDDRKLSMVLMTDCTEEEVEDQFFRLNNGSPLTNPQKARVSLGNELALFIDQQEKKPLFAKKSKFTLQQRIGGDVQMCILQAVTLIMGFEYESFNYESMAKFAEWFRNNHRDSDLAYCSDIFDKLDEAIPETKKPHPQMKKTNIPILAYHIQTADAIGLSLEDYGKWIQTFLDSYSPECEYAKYCGSGSTSKEKVAGRVDYVEREIRKLVE